MGSKRDMFNGKKVLMASAITVAISLAASAAVIAEEGAATSVNQNANPYAPNYDHDYRHGVVPTLETHQRMRLWQSQHGTTGPQTLSYGGGVDGIGVTSGKPKVYLVVFGSQWGTPGKDANGNMTFSNDKLGAVPYLQQMFKG